MSKPRQSAAVIKFPIGRVVREHRIGAILAATPTAEAIEQALRSVSHAIKTLRHQAATLNLLAARERKKETPDQRARLVTKNMSRIYAREAEDGTNFFRRRDDTDDGGSAA